MTQVAAGWYDDADQDFLRWWDGTQWTENRYAKGSASPDLTTEQSESANPTSPEPAATHDESKKLVPAKPISKMWKREARAFAIEIFFEYEKLSAIVDKHGLRTFAEIDAYRAAADDELVQVRADRQKTIDDAAAKLQGIEARIVEASTELANVQAQFIDVNAAVEIQSVGLFDFENPAQSSAQLATRLEDLRYRIKELVRAKRAVTSAPKFLFNNSEVQGRKFVNDMSKVLLRAYNAEAENAVKATRAGNLAVAQTRLTRAAEQIAKSGSMIDLEIHPDYHRLRLEEIALASEHLQAVQIEKELERDRRAQLREEQKAAAELSREKERLDKERSHYLATLAVLESNGDSEGIERMRAKLADVDRALADVDYRAANVRAGYVYVISNIGAFGERMVKIGMTRRLEPMDRVTELGDASVPFRFDVHALFFAGDAVGIETLLHQTFAKQRVNRVNLRREFFYVTPDEVLDALKKHQVELVEYELAPAAEEYRASHAALEGERLLESASPEAQ